jgi:hypothetical protein
MSHPFCHGVLALVALSWLAVTPVFAQSPTLVSEPAILEALGGIKLELVRIETALKGEITRAETALRGEVARLDTRQGATETQLKALRDDLRWGGGLLLTAMLALVGFVVWDRRTAVAPAQPTYRAY